MRQNSPVIVNLQRTTVISSWRFKPSPIPNSFIWEGVIAQKGDWIDRSRCVSQCQVDHADSTLGIPTYYLSHCLQMQRLLVQVPVLTVMWSMVTQFGFTFCGENQSHDYDCHVEQRSLLHHNCMMIPSPAVGTRMLLASIFSSHYTVRGRATLFYEIFARLNPEPWIGLMKQPLVVLTDVRL
jgi:hypothetical protein